MCCHGSRQTEPRIARSPAARGGRAATRAPSSPDQSGAGQEMAASTSSATFFSTVGLHRAIAYDTGHTSPSSRFAASWNSRVE